MPQDVDVLITADGDGLGTPGVDEDTGVIIIPHEDGDVTVDLNPQPEPPKGGDKFGDNLAEVIEPHELRSISNYLLDGIEEDERDRTEYVTTRADGMDLLAVKVERPGGGVVAATAGAQTPISVVRDPIMLEAVTRFQANAYAELCPSEGPCKVTNYGDESSQKDKLAEDLQKDLNFYLTNVATEYYPDTRKMLFWVGYASGMFKKVYRCPLRRRPVSESVDATDLILPSNITDIKNSPRVTHRISMRQATMKRMQILGAYRRIDLTQPTTNPTTLQQKEGSIVGIDAKIDRPEDQDYTVYECYCELDIRGFEHKEGGKPTGLPLPYRVAIDKDSREILAVHRNWREDDEDQLALIPFVAFLYITGIGIYGLGLLHYLGNITMALTAMLRLAIDNGMFSNFPGFLIDKTATRQTGPNNLQVAPGGGTPVDTGGKDIRAAVMPLPFKELSAAFVQLIGQLREVGMRLGSAAELQVGEGKQDAPVGTTLALIEQATKIEGSVHKSLHAAQAEELSQFKELFREDPEALWRTNKKPALGDDKATRIANFQQAIEDYRLTPASDPNVPSQMHRLAKASGLLQIAGAYGQLFNMPEVLTRAAAMMKIDDFKSLLLPPPKPGIAPPDPKLVAELIKAQLQNAKLDLDKLKLLLGFVDKQKDRDSKEAVESLKIANSLVVHPESDPVLDKQLNQMAPLIQPAMAPAAPPAGPAPGMGGMSEGGEVPDEEPWDPADLADAWDAAADIVAALRESGVVPPAAGQLPPYSTIFPPADGTLH